MYTDGLCEHADRQGGKFGPVRLHAALAAGRTESLAALADRVLAEAAAYAGGAAPQDDISLLTFEFKGGAGG